MKFPVAFFIIRQNQEPPPFCRSSQDWAHLRETIDIRWRDNHHSHCLWAEWRYRSNKERSHNHCRHTHTRPHLHGLWGSRPTRRKRWTGSLLLLKPTQTKGSSYAEAPAGTHCPNRLNHKNLNENMLTIPGRPCDYHDPPHYHRQNILTSFWPRGDGMVGNPLGTSGHFKIILDIHGQTS